VLAAQTPELSALGAAFAGMLGMQIRASLQDLEGLPASFVEYQPQLPQEQAAELLAGWQHAVRQVLA